MSNKKDDDIRELAVCLAIADAASGNGYYRLGSLDAELTADDFGVGISYHEEEYIADDGSVHQLKMVDYDGSNSGFWDDEFTESNDFQDASLMNGYDFCKALREYNVNIDSHPVDCECDWGDKEIGVAKRNYALGAMISDYFGIGPGVVERVVWHGPENVRGDERLMVPPADIGIKLVGTPSRDYLVPISDETRISFGALSPEDDYNELLKFKDYASDEDIMISLKDGSDILGNYGFAAFANLMLGTQFESSIDCFETYSPAEYDAWFDTAWNLMLDQLDNGPIDMNYPRGSSSCYSIYYNQNGDSVVFERVPSSGDVETLSMPLETTRQEWMCTHYGSGKAKKALSTWCTEYGKELPEYIQAQKVCSYITAQCLATLLGNGGAKEEWYNLIGWRLPEYYYANIVRRKLSLYSVPSIFNAEYYPIVPTVDQNPLVTDLDDGPGESLSTQAIVPFMLGNPELGINARFELIVRFKDGTFNGIPQAVVHTKDKQHGMYLKLYDAPMADYVPD